LHYPESKKIIILYSDENDLIKVLDVKYRKDLGGLLRERK